MKHKMWSRLLSMALAVMMIASIVPNSAFAEAASEITSTSQVQEEETPVEETQTPQEEVTVPEAETPAEPSTEPAPTEEPVAEPTAEPTVEPTAEPTQAPAETVAPSEQPSAEPTAAPEATEIPEGTAVPSETPAPSASPLPSESPVPSETPVPTETPEATEKPAIDGQALLDELMAIEDDEAFMKAVNELTEEQAAALEALGEEALAEYALRVESLTAQEETVELNAEDKEFTAAVKDAEGVTVTVKVPAGSLPVNAQLVAEMIEQDTEKYTKAEEALDDETLNEQPTEYAGMVAMDIRFEVDGEEIEPLQPVEVTIDAQALLPEDADPETVAVQHLKEDETGAVVAVETVADATEETGDVTVEATQTEEPAMDMASTFAVDGFSTFTITWGNYFKVTVHYVDENGTEIPGTRIQKDTIQNRQTKTFENYAGSIDGYEYTHEARYQNVNGAIVTKVEAKEDGRFNKTRQLIFYNNNKPVATLTYGWETEEVDVYLVYKEQESGGGGTVDPGEKVGVTTGKTVFLQDGQQPGGLYDLTLSVSGDRGTTKEKAKVDVLFILDESNSMGQTWTNGQKRIAAAKAAIGQIMGRGNDEGLSDNENLDVQYALVGFGGGDSTKSDPHKDAGLQQNWTADVNAVYNAIPDIHYDPWGYSSNIYGGGTNYEAGFRQGKETLKGREDALTVVIFISDGNPGYYYTNNGATDGTSNPGSKYDATALEHAVNECKTLSADYFYFVGVTNSVDSDVFNDITSAVPVVAAQKGSISANDPDDLLEAFTNIQKQITFFACQDVTLTDTMSKYAEVVADATGARSFTVAVDRGGVKKSQDVVISEKNSSQSVTVNNVELTVTYKDGTITLDFPNDYQLEEDCTYSISTTIKPTELAMQQGESSYNGTGDPNTGEHAGKEGFYSNNNDVSKVTYTPVSTDEAGMVHPGTETSTNFPKPVIQVKDTSDEYPVRFYLEGVNNNAGATNYDFKDDWAKLDAVYSGGYVALPDANTCVYSEDLVVDNGVHQASDTITGDTGVRAWLNTNNANPVGLSVDSIKDALQALVDAGRLTNNATLVSVGGTTYTVQDVLNNPEDFELLYTQVAENEDYIQEYYRGNRNGNYQKSYHVHLTVKYKPGDMTITKTFSGVDALPENYQVKVKLGDQVIKTLTLRDAEHAENTSTYTWTLYDLNGADYTVSEENADVDGQTLKATFTVQKENGETLTTEGTSATVPVEMRETTTVNIRNEYTPANGNLVITKTLKDMNKSMGDDATFQFKITNTDTGMVWYRYLTFTQADTQRIELKDIPAGKYTVEEMSSLGYELEDGYSETVSTEVSYEVAGSAVFVNKSTGGNIPGDQDIVRNNFRYDSEQNQWVFEQE